MIEALVSTFIICWLILLLIFFYENMKFKAAVRLWNRGRKDEAKAYCPMIETYMGELGDDC
jgi:hypothetical protein